MGYQKRVRIVVNDDHEVIQPIVAFVESDKVDVMEKLLLKIREELAKDPAIWTAELINEIDALLGDEANGDHDT